jgi:hypothetical protein
VKQYDNRVRRHLLQNHRSIAHQLDWCYTLLKELRENHSAMKPVKHKK